MKSIAKDLKRTAKLLCSKGRMQCDENLDHFYGAVGIFFDCTHLVQLMFAISLDSFDVSWEKSIVGKAGDPAPVIPH